jgi:hypothetical protein
MTFQTALILPIWLLTVAAPLSACSSGTPPAINRAEAQRPRRVKEQNIALGREYKTADDLYHALRDQAEAGRRLDWAALPDWSGIYTRSPVPHFVFDPDQREGGLPSARLTPTFRAKMLKRFEDAKRGIEWDPLSKCDPPGYPRWLAEPFLREFIVTPDQTWLINEMANDIRRIYTDGRGHVPEGDRYPLYNGDSIGFWDDDNLVIHTNQLRAGIYEESSPDYTDQVETVEIWRKQDSKTISVDVWVYDPPALVEPWYARQTYVKLTDPGKNLRIRYWNCSENENNSVYETKDGRTEFGKLTVHHQAGRAGR